MPRQPRLDIPDLLHHVIVRGIERRPIFKDDTDRRDFVDRLCLLLGKSGTRCYAWALIPNHVHLLLRPGEQGLSRFMRRLLTGYAVVFNRRHNRSGHLFQNRYKSILCEEDAYLQELVRYIHLNPLRARQCATLKELDSFSWSGHAELLGRRPNTGLAVDEVLQFFGRQQGAARKAYRSFIEDGLTMGKRPEFVGGGLLRSRQKGLNEEFQDSDERVLGSGAFVSGLRQDGHLEPQAFRQKVGLPILEEKIGAYFGLPHLRQRGRQNCLSQARAFFCYYAVRFQGYTGVEVGEYLGIGRPSVSRSVVRGESVVGGNEELCVVLEETLKQ